MSINDTAVATLRAEFPALQQIEGGQPPIFLDGPDGTQAHGSVIAAMQRYLTEANSNVHGAFLYSRRTDKTVTEARRALADFLNRIIHHGQSMELSHIKGWHMQGFSKDAVTVLFHTIA